MHMEGTWKFQEVCVCDRLFVQAGHRILVV